MIAIAIIGVLAAIAVPAYSNYITRAKVSEGINLVAPFKVAISECYHTHPDATERLDECAVGGSGIPDQQVGDYATVAPGAKGAGGTIIVKMSGTKSKDLPAKVKDETFTLTAEQPDAKSAITWKCTGVTGELKTYLPSSLACN